LISSDTCFTIKRLFFFGTAAAGSADPDTDTDTAATATAGAAVDADAIVVTGDEAVVVNLLPVPTLA